MNTNKNEFLELDKKLELLKQQGKKVPTKKMIKTKQQIEGIKKAAIVNSGLLDYIEENIKAGMSTEQIDIMAKDYTKKHNAICADYQYCGYPKHICCLLYTSRCV